MALDDGSPRRAETAGELGAERGGVDPADGPLLVLQPPGVEREPRAGRVLDLRPDHGVGVELGVGRPAGVLSEEGDGEAAGVDLIHTVLPSAGDGSVALEPVERGHDGVVVRGEHLGTKPWIIRQRPQHRHRLGGRERRVERSRRSIDEAAADWRPVDRVPGVEHSPQLPGIDLIAQTDGGSAGAPPPAGRFVGVEVVVDGTTGGCVEVGALGQTGVVLDKPGKPFASGLERRHPEHGNQPCDVDALVCRVAAGPGGTMSVVAARRRVSGLTLAAGCCGRPMGGAPRGMARARTSYLRRGG